MHPFTSATPKTSSRLRTQYGPRAPSSRRCSGGAFSYLACCTASSCPFHRVHRDGARAQIPPHRPQAARPVPAALPDLALPAWVISSDGGRAASPWSRAVSSRPARLRRCRLQPARDVRVLLRVRGKPQARRPVVTLIGRHDPGTGGAGVRAREPSHQQRSAAIMLSGFTDNARALLVGTNIEGPSSVRRSPAWQALSRYASTPRCPMFRRVATLPGSPPRTSCYLHFCLALAFILLMG